MVRVYIWRFRGKREAWGHASMEVQGQYISWWPVASRRVRSKFHRNVYSAHPIGNRSLYDDIRDEGGSPDHTVVISGLEEGKILSWWRRTALSWGGGRALGPPSVAWSSLGSNCSQIVATALKQGGGNEFSAWRKSWNIVWTPNDVLEYAESIARGMERP